MSLVLFWFPLLPRGDLCQPAGSALRRYAPRPLVMAPDLNPRTLLPVLLYYVYFITISTLLTFHFDYIILFLSLLLVQYTSGLILFYFSISGDDLSFPLFLKMARFALQVTQAPVISSGARSSEIKQDLLMLDIITLFLFLSDIGILLYDSVLLSCLFYPLFFRF